MQVLFTQLGHMIGFIFRFEVLDDFKQVGVPRYRFEFRQPSPPSSLRLFLLLSEDIGMVQRAARRARGSIIRGIFFAHDFERHFTPRLETDGSTDAPLVPCTDAARAMIVGKTKRVSCWRPF